MTESLSSQVQSTLCPTALVDISSIFTWTATGLQATQRLNIRGVGGLPAIQQGCVPKKVVK